MRIIPIIDKDKNLLIRKHRGTLKRRIYAKPGFYLVVEKADVNEIIFGTFSSIVENAAAIYSVRKYIDKEQTWGVAKIPCQDGENTMAVRGLFKIKVQNPKRLLEKAGINEDKISIASFKEDVFLPKLRQVIKEILIQNEYLQTERAISEQILENIKICEVFSEYGLCYKSSEFKVSGIKL